MNKAIIAELINLANGSAQHGDDLAVVKICCDAIAEIERLEEVIFDAGVLWAAARIVEFHDQVVLARELLIQSGVDTERANEVDKPFIKKAIESERTASKAEGCDDGQ